MVNISITLPPRDTVSCKIDIAIPLENLIDLSSMLQTLHPKGFLSQELAPSTPQTYIREVKCHKPSSLKGVEEEIRRAETGLYFYSPTLCSEGEGGTYFLKDKSGHEVAVFKPTDEDPQGLNNPKRKELEPMRKSIPVGQTAIREMAAYLLDGGFSSVPPTSLVQLSHDSFHGPKVGSFQKYMDFECASWDLAPYNFSVEDVQRIGVLDIRIFNTDRHGGNILVTVPDELPQFGDSEFKLVPIDHGFAFPTSLEEASFDWLYWPQAKQPFSEEILDYIRNIDVDADSTLLRSLGLCRDAVHVNRITTTLLKKGASAGLTLYGIAKLCYRNGSALSPLELSCNQAHGLAASHGTDFWKFLDPLLDELVSNCE